MSRFSRYLLESILTIAVLLALLAFAYPPARPFLWTLAPVFGGIVFLLLLLALGLAVARLLSRPRFPPGGPGRRLTTARMRRLNAARRWPAQRRPPHRAAEKEAGPAAAGRPGLQDGPAAGPEPVVLPHAAAGDSTSPAGTFQHPRFAVPPPAGPSAAGLGASVEPASAALRVVEGDTYTRRRERRSSLWAWLLVGLAVALVVGFVVLAAVWPIPAEWGVARPWLLVPGAVVVVLLLLALALALRHVDISTTFGQGRGGEEAAVAAMRDLLDGSWTLYRNVVPDRRGGDIDLVLAGPGGVWAFEVKTYTNRVRNRGDEWHYWGHGRWRRLSAHPGRQCERNARRLHQYLVGRGLGQVWVNAVVIWAGQSSLLTLEHPRVDVWTMEELRQRLGSMAQAHKLDAEQVRRVTVALERLRVERRAGRASGAAGRRRSRAATS